jgi:hypothetical protein
MHKTPKRKSLPMNTPLPGIVKIVVVKNATPVEEIGNGRLEYGYANPTDTVVLEITAEAGYEWQAFLPFERGDHAVQLEGRELSSPAGTVMFSREIKVYPGRENRGFVKGNDGAITMMRVDRCGNYMESRVGLRLGDGNSRIAISQITRARFYQDGGKPTCPALEPRPEVLKPALGMLYVSTQGNADGLDPISACPIVSIEQTSPAGKPKRSDPRVRTSRPLVTA